MGSFSLMHWVIVALVVLVLFGRGKISETMGDFGKGVKSFRKGLSDDEAPPRQPPAADPAALAPPPAGQAEGTAEPVKQPEQRSE
jgi:sec-independent protein translocase protein TatA